MAFNSVTFLLVFLPLALLAYYGAAATRFHALRLWVLIGLGLAFYGRNQAQYLPLFAASMLANFSVAVILHRLPVAALRRRWLLMVGVCANIGLLLYFKYFTSLLDFGLAVMGRPESSLGLIVPLAISFFTFQQVAFLVDVARQRTEPGPLVRYLAFVSFFPQLLAGPISLHQEVAPQLAARPTAGQLGGHLLAGLVMFSIGLFKKTVIADTAAQWADPVFAGAATGMAPGFFQAWLGAVTYTLQIYFDFSGYSDMALGVARMFGIVLPLNFFSPFRARSMAELWQRWHMTLGRWVRVYIFQPLAVPLARLAAERNLSRHGAHALATLIPTFVAMLVIGTWHGPNWTFVLFGMMHGTFMCINEIYNFRTRKRRKAQPDSPATLRLYTGLTVLAFVLAEVPFRSVDVPSALRIFAGMVGLHGSGMHAGVWSAATFANLALILVCGWIIYRLPNTAQFLSNAVPALEWAKWREIDRPALEWQFQPRLLWSLVIGGMLFLGFAFLSRGTPTFIYFDF